MTEHEARRILEAWQFVDDTQMGVIIRIPVFPREYDEFREIIRNSLLNGPSSMRYLNPDKEVDHHTVELFENCFMGSFRSWCRMKNKPETPLNMFLFLAKLGLIDVERLNEDEESEET